METFAFVASLASLASAYNNGVGRLPYMGWNTWCTDETCGYDVCNSDEIRDVAKAMQSNGMYDAGYRYINMDDCWSACNRTANGSLYAEPTRFPDGMAAMIAEVHAMKTPVDGDTLKYGLYTDYGTHTCSGGHRDGCKPPGLYGHYTQDAHTLAAWKVDLIKVYLISIGVQNVYILLSTQFDDCNKPGNESSEDLNKQWSEALNKTGRHILLEVDGTYSLPAPSYVKDIAQAWKINPDHHDDWDSTKSLIADVIKQNVSQLSGSYGWGYFDFLMTGGQGCSGGYDNGQHLHCPGQTDTEYMTEFAVFAIAGSPLLVATDIRNMTDIMKKVLLNTEIIAVNQEDATPVGNLVYYHDCSGPKDTCQVWARQMKGDGVAAVALLNVDDKQHGITVEFDKLGMMGWTSETQVMVRDLWEHKDLGMFTGSYDTQVPAHGNFFGMFTQQ